MSRVRFADQCRDHHRKRGKVHVCGRKIGHRGDHGHGKVTWPRRIPAPPPGSSSVAAPMR